jgi:tetratricopeptide (TPR) repeat protein
MQDVLTRLRQQDVALLRMTRKVAANPFLAITIAGFVLSVLASASLFFVARPPYPARELLRGAVLTDNGNYSQAIMAFTNAETATEQRPEALRRRGLAHLSNGDAKKASSDFNQLYKEYQDSRAAALIGYCFNLQKQHSAAIMWYEKALSEGIESASLRNNLGISYAICQSHVGHLERFELATESLERALEIDSNLFAARQNLVEVAVVRGDELQAADIPLVARRADELLSLRPNDKTALILACRAYGLISTLDPVYVDRCAEIVGIAVELGFGPSKSELKHSSSFSALRLQSAFAGLLNRAPDSLARGVQSVSFQLPVVVEDFVETEVSDGDSAN